VTDARPRPAFAHASEAELARILDFYEVAWQYEPHTFPILFDREGTVLESFSPDFYLPDLDLYVEITTLKQRLVRKKNRKLRRLRELYPDLRIKLLYARDFRALLLKYGRISLADALSGAEGQSTPPRREGSGASARTARSPAPAPAHVAAAPAPIARAGDAPAPANARSRRSRRTRAEARARAAARAQVTAPGPEITT
jgi:hypothetical protein